MKNRLEGIEDILFPIAIALVFISLSVLALAIAYRVIVG